MKVKDFMCNHVNFVKPNTSVQDCAKMMCECHIGCTPVCDDSNRLVGIDVIHSSTPFKNEFSHNTAVFRSSVADFSIAVTTFSGMFNFFKFSLPRNFCIIWLAFVKYVPKLSNKFEPSETSVAIPQVNNPIIIPSTTTITIIALVFRLNLHFLISSLIAGSNKREITKAIRKGI